MKKNASLLAAALAVTLSASPVSAASNNYVSGNVGISWLNNFRYDSILELPGTGVMLSGAYGATHQNYRIEGELGYQNSDIDNDTGNVSVISLLGNGYYDIKAEGFTPYLTAGGGVANVRFHDIGGLATTHNTTLAFQIGAGAEFPLGGSTKLDARYRYFSTLDFTTDPGLNTHIASHSVTVGLKFDL
ncbi:MAG: outer membrane beta-barrel protein [Chlorobiaceae bacterium]